MIVVVQALRLLRFLRKGAQGNLLRSFCVKKILQQVNIFQLISRIAEDVPCMFLDNHPE